MFIPSRQNLRAEQNALAAEIAKQPCRECAARGMNSCHDYGPACWLAYRKEARTIQKTFLLPLHAMLTQRLISSLVLGACCVLLLMFPIQNHKHHVLEYYVHCATSHFKDAWPQIRQDFREAMAEYYHKQALAADRAVKND